jgi:hypothetical protein
LPVKHSQIEGVSVIFQADQPLSGPRVAGQPLTGKEIFFQGTGLGAVTIPNPRAGEYRVSLRAPAGARVQAFVLYDYGNLRFTLTASEDELDGVITAHVAAYRQDRLIQDKDFYASLLAEAVFRDEAGQESILAPAPALDGLTAVYQREPPYQVAVTARIGLPLQDALTGGVVSVTRQAPPPPGEPPFPWIPVLTGAAIGLGLIALFFFLPRRPAGGGNLLHPAYTFAGKLQGYIIYAADGGDYPPFSIPLAGWGSRSFSLTDGFTQALGGDLGIAGAKHIHFAPGPDHTVVFQHTTDQAILIGPVLTEPGKRYTLNSGGKLYFTLQNGDIELELHYRSAALS